MAGKARMTRSWKKQKLFKDKPSGSPQDNVTQST